MPSFTLNDLADSEHESWGYFEEYMLEQLKRAPTEPAAMRMSMIPVHAYHRMHDRLLADGKNADEAHIAGCLAASVVTELALDEQWRQP